MDDKRELNDILIGGDDDNRSSQSKKIILLLVGIIILITAIVVIIISMLSGNKNEEVLTTNKENYPPINQNAMNIPIDTNDDDKFEQIVQEIKAQQQKNETKEMPKEVQEVEIPKITMPEKPKEAPKKIKEPTPKPQVRVVNRRNNGDIATAGHYLQVGAFSKKPNQQFLDKLNMYSYRTQEILINSKVITRYLVGPYNSKNEAQKDYENVSKDIATPVYLRIQ